MPGWGFFLTQNYVINSAVFPHLLIQTRFLLYVIISLNKSFMNKTLLLLLVSAILSSGSFAQIHNQFFWDNFGSNERIADSGPNATNSGGLAEAQATGSAGSAGALAPGSTIINTPFGTIVNKQDINLTLDNSGGAFNQDEIEISIDYRRDQTEQNAGFYVREPNVAGGPQFYLGIEFGKLTLRFTWDNGTANGQTESFALLGFWPGDAIPADQAWRSYRFTYEASVGLATLSVNGTQVYSVITAAAAPLMWPSNGPVIGYDMDNEGIDFSLLDNAIIQSPEPLPVEWGVFEGEQAQRSIQLDWETFEQINFDHFEVQHSTDGKRYSPIGKVTGPTNTQTTQQYAFTHERPEPGANYYRLRQVDLDGAVHYSNRIEVNFELDAASAFAFYPNPVQDRLFIGINEVQPQATAVQIHLYDLSGRLLSEQVRELIPYQNETFAETQELPSGAYLVKVSWMGRAYYHRMTK